MFFRSLGLKKVLWMSVTLGVIFESHSASSMGSELLDPKSCDQYKTSCERSTPESLQQRAWTCETEFSSKDCRGFFSGIQKKITELETEIKNPKSDKNKELLKEEIDSQKNLLNQSRKCDTYNLCIESQTSTETYLKDCLSQMLDPTIDGLKFVISNGPALLKETNQRRAALQRNPQIYTQSMDELKQGLLQPFYALSGRKINNPVLKSFLEKLQSLEKSYHQQKLDYQKHLADQKKSSYLSLFNGKDPEKMCTCLEYQPGPFDGGSNQWSKTIPCNCFRSYLQSASRDLAELSLLARQELVEPRTGIVDMIGKIIQNQQQKYQCLNTDGRREMICYAIFSVIDPLMIYGAGTKIARWTKAAAVSKAVQVEKVAQVEKALQTEKVAPAAKINTSVESKQVNLSKEKATTEVATGEKTPPLNYRKANENLEYKNTTKKPQDKSQNGERRHRLDDGSPELKASSLTKVRQDYVKKYQKDATIRKERLAYSALVKNPQNKTSTFVFENAILKYLNDFFKDKAFPTALNNRYNQLLRDKVERFIADYNRQNPTKKLEPYFYSDWKAFHVALKNGDHQELVSEIGKIYQESTLEFLSELRNKKLLRDEDIGKIQKAYLAGSGENTDEASRAARLARDVHHERTSDAEELATIPKMVDFRSSEFNAQDKIKTNLQFADSLRSEVQSLLGKNRLLKQAEEIGFVSKGTNGAKVPTGTVLEVMRKNEGKLPAVGSPDFAIKEQEVLDNVLSTLEYRFPEMRKWKLSTDEKNNFVRKLLDYSKLVDENAPALIKVDRNLASLDAADLGGHTADVAALGAANLEKLAKDIQASMKHIDFSQDNTNFQPLFQRIRKGESLVTEKLNTLTRSMKVAAKEIFKGDARMICSGDDCVLIFKKEVPMEKKLAYLREVHKNLDKPSSLRISFIPQKVKNIEVRTSLATQGESLEKIIRQRMEKVLEYKRLQQLGISIDMKTTVKQQGSIDVIFGNSKVELKPGERQKLNAILQESIEQLNKDIHSADGSISNYHPGNIHFSERRGPTQRRSNQP
jgi:hypothetical protein